MNQYSILVLKTLRFVFQKVLSNKRASILPVLNMEEGNYFIYKTLSSNKPCMIARYGATELACILNYLSIKKQQKNFWAYVKGEIDDWWWNPKIVAQMEKWSGFFPPTENGLIKFSEMYLSDSKHLDALAVFSDVKRRIHVLNDYLPEELKYFPLVVMDSFIHPRPWTLALKGMNILVVHPFAELIESQYEKRNFLFPENDVLPEFNLRTIKAVQSLGGVSCGYKDWFEALDWMKKEMDRKPYDIALIGCGAYGFPLAAYAKKTGHKAVHIGGSLQLLFGIKGKRWEDPTYAVKFGLPADLYINLMANPEWVRPVEYRTIQSENVENACYW